MGRLVSLLIIPLLVSASDKHFKFPELKIPIQWSENINGDFSFTNQWSYPEGIYKNRFGQLSCDGICPPEIESMFDENRKIIPDSLERFYQYVDTSHNYHTIQSSAQVYEWAGTDFINFRKTNQSIIGNTSCNIATHSSLYIEIIGDSVSAWIEFNSITDIKPLTFPLSNGTITIDKALFNKGIIKAEFDFNFINTLESDFKIWWKGKIYCEVDSLK